MSDDQELIFYQRAREVVKGFNELIKSWPKTIPAPEVARQVLRSAMSGRMLTSSISTLRSKRTTRKIQEEIALYNAEIQPFDE